MVTDISYIKQTKAPLWGSRKAYSQFGEGFTGRVFDEMEFVTAAIAITNSVCQHKALLLTFVEIRAGVAVPDPEGFGDTGEVAGV